MAALPPQQSDAMPLQGFTSFQLRGPLFAHLHAAGTPRARAGNRWLLSEQYATLLLLSFVTPP
jgi:hypothetical protein